MVKRVLVGVIFVPLIIALILFATACSSSHEAKLVMSAAK